MRASTLFALTIAILLGLAVVVGAKLSGFFDPKTVVEPTKPPPPQVLAAKMNLFEGMAISANDVYVRPLYEHEKAEYERNPAKFLAPKPLAAQWRVLMRPVEADTALVHDLFDELKIPRSLSERLDPRTRAVHLNLPKDRAAGGLLLLNEYVDVYLSTNICADDKCNAPATYTALIAKDLKIIAKRNTLWTTMAVIPENQPVQFTLQANPYRAALIEHSQLKGWISLVPSPKPKAGILPVVSDPDSREFRDEEQKVAAFLAGEISVGDTDLERIFNLKPRPPRVPPIMVERYSGVVPLASRVFDVGGAALEGSATVFTSTGASTMGYRFSHPDAKVGSYCPTCPK